MKYENDTQSLSHQLSEAKHEASELCQSLERRVLDAEASAEKEKQRTQMTADERAKEVMLISGALQELEARLTNNSFVMLCAAIRLGEELGYSPRPSKTSAQNPA